MPRVLTSRRGSADCTAEASLKQKSGQLPVFILSLSFQNFQMKQIYRNSAMKATYSCQLD